jgi:hypothetical protein
MTASLETLVIAAYVFADSLSITSQRARWKDHRRGADLAGGRRGGDPALLGPPVPRGGRQAVARVPSAPARPDPVQPPAAPADAVLLQHSADGRRTDRRRPDPARRRTLIACANYAGCASKCELAPHAGYGYCPSKSQFYRGMRLVLVVAWKGCRSGMTCAPRASASRSGCSNSAWLNRTAPVRRQGPLGTRVRAHARAHFGRTRHARQAPPRRQTAGRGRLA